jgi:integrase/recombinase XerD
MSGRGGGIEVKELRSAINKYVNKAEHVLSNLPNPTRETFQRVFKSEAELFLNNKTDVTFLYEEYIRNLKKEDRLRTAENYG